MADYYISQGGSRILNATRVDQSSADNANVIDWVKTNDFIIAININSNGKDTVAAQYKLRWRNKTDAGSFADVASTGVINYSATTDLVNGNPIAVGGRKCDSQGGDTWAAGEEVEGASLSDSIDLADEYETEIHFALDCSGATDEKEYEFELYDSTLGVTRGTCGATITMAAAAAEGWLSGWSYRKEISITGQSGAGTLYQVDLDIGDSAGGDFHLEGNCTNFPQDIQVTDNDGETLLDFWIEDITTDPLKMWVEVADDLGSNQTIYVYYGKSGATTDSSGDDTFLFFDGAESGAIADKWSGTDANTTYSTDQAYSGSNSIKMDSETAAALLEISHTITTSGRATEIEMYDISTDTSLHQVPHIGIAGIGSQLGVWTGESTTYYAYFDSVWATSAIARTTGWHRLKWVHDGTTLTRFIDGTQVDSGAQSPANVTLNSGYSTWLGVSYYDNIRVRKYNSPEPAFSSAGSEETPSAGVSPTAVFYGPLVGPLGGPI